MYSPNVQLIICPLLSISGILTKQMKNHKPSFSQQQNMCKRDRKNMINKYTSDNNNCSTSLLNHELMYYTMS